MIVRAMSVAAVAALMAGPALGDCMAEIDRIEQSVLSAPTGGSGLPATEHQQQVTSEIGEDSDVTAVEPAAGPAGGGPAAASTEHQREVIGGTSGETGQLLAEARQMAEAGDEQGCLDKVGEAGALLGGG